jgi:hypothetical protein
MGITISFHLKSPFATVRQGINQLQAIAQDLPFDYVGKVVELVGEQCEYQDSDSEELLVLKIEAVAKRIEQGKLQKYKPAHLIGFTAIPGKGCEYLSVFLAHYPELGADWYCESYCKTQFAIEFGGIPHFVFCHTAIVTFLDRAAKMGLLDTTLDLPVIDEANYWKQRNLKELALTAQLEQEKIEGMGTLLKNYVAKHKNNEAKAFWSWFESKIDSDLN